MIVYFDGSHTRGGRKTKFDFCVFSWGIVALSDDEHIEISGHHKITDSAPKRRLISGSHEVIAFVEAVIFASARCEAKDVTFYADDEMCVYANYAMNSSHYPSGFLDAFYSHLTKIASLYSQEVFDKVLVFLKESRFVKVKAHKTTIYNKRVDYLAKKQRDICVLDDVNIKNFDDWLKGIY